VTQGRAAFFLCWKKQTGMIEPQVFQVGLGITSVLYVICIVMYFLRRKKFPIAQRLPLIVTLELILMTAVPFESLVAAGFPDHPVFANCQYFLIMVTIFDHLPVMIMAFRIFWLFLKDFNTKSLVKSRVSEAEYVETHSPPKIKNPFSKVTKIVITYLLEKKNLTINQIAGIFVLPAALLALIDSIIVFANTEIPKHSVWSIECGIALFNASEALKCFIFVYFGIILTFIIFFLLQIDDNFHLGTEIRALLILAMGITLIKVFSAVPVLYVPVFLESRAWNFTVGWILMPLVFVASGYYPLYLSIEQRKKERAYRKASLESKSKFNSESDVSVSSPSPEELMCCLRHSKARVLFIKFLEKEFAVENLFFIEAASAFEDRCLALQKKAENATVDPNQLEAVLNFAKKIADEFVFASAPHCVNLSYASRNATLEALEKCLSSKELNSTLYTKPKDEIIYMLTRDSFSRFAITKPYMDIKLTTSPPTPIILT
jgi:hypothetical protein